MRPRLKLEELWIGKFMKNESERLPNSVKDEVDTSKALISLELVPSNIMFIAVNLQSNPLLIVTILVDPCRFPRKRPSLIF